MGETFDPYLHWLGIRDPHRPPHHYRLLGIEQFESDPDIIANAADRQMAHVRSFQAGRHSAESQKLLNELAAAKVCLLSPQKKADYDAGLRAQQPQPVVVPTPVALPLPPPVPPPVEAAVPPVAGIAPPPVPPPLFSAAFPTATVSAGPPPSAVPQPATRTAADGRRPPQRRGKKSPGWIAFLTAMAALGLAIAGLAIYLSAGPKGQSDHSGSRSTPPALPVPVRPKPEPKSPPQPKVQPQPKPPAKPEPIPRSSPVYKAIEAARTAMRAHDLAAALGHVQDANRTVGSDARARDEIGQVIAVLTYLENFERALKQAVASLKPDEQLAWPDGPATVVAVEGGQLTVRIRGRESTYPLAKIPLEPALAIAQRRLPRGEESLLWNAAWAVFDPGGDRARARRLCDEARQQGLRVDGLLQELSLMTGPGKTP